MILAILRAQLLSMRGLGWGRTAGSWLAMIPVILYMGIWALAGFGAFAGFSSITDVKLIHTALAMTLFGVFVYWQIAPVITASMGASLDLQKLIVYPIPLDKLFIVEIALRFFTVGEMLWVLAGSALGVLFNRTFGGWATLPGVLAGFFLYLLINLILAAGVRSLIERLFKMKRAREIGMLFFLAIMVLPALLPFLGLNFERISQYLPVQPFWAWAAAAQIALGGSLAESSKSILTLLVWGAIVYRFARRQFYSSLRHDPNSGRKVAAKPGNVPQWTETLFRIPGRLFGDPLGALLEKEMRSLSRTAGFRLAFVMGFTFGIVIFLPQVLMKRSRPTFVTEHFLAWVSMYSLLLVSYYIFWDVFGCDRSAAQFYFAAPVSFRKVLTAKNIAGLIWVLLDLILITVVYQFLPLHSGWFGVVEAYGVTFVTCLYLFGIGNMTSVRFPVPIDPDKMGRGAASRSTSMLAMLLLPIAFLPIGLAYWGGQVTGSHGIFLLLLLLAGVIGGVFYWIGTDSALNLSLERREAMIATLSKGQGPLSIT